MRGFAGCALSVFAMAASTTVPARVSMGHPGSVTVLTGTTVWSSRQTWVIDGPLALGHDAELVIEAGTRVEAAPGAFLSVGREARIRAIGTALQPIVFTCKSAPAYEGCWEGLQLRGNARLNFGAPSSPPARGVGSAGCRETGTGDLRYGGCDDADSSGVLRYVRVEYANSGLQLLGAGSGTSVEFVQVNRSRGHGLQISGGEVNLRYAFLTANLDRGLRWLGGWRGRGQFIAIQQDAERHRGGLIGSNAAADDTTRIQGNPRSAPVLHNLTIVAPSLPSNPHHATNPPGIALTGGTSGQLRNMVIHRPVVGFQLEDESTCLAFSVEPVVMTHVLVSGAVANGDPDDDPVCQPYASPNVESEWLFDAANASMVVSDPVAVAQMFVGPENLITPDARPRANSEPTTFPAAPIPPDPFFQQAAYLGAVEPATAASSNIPWYAGWTVPAPMPPAGGMASGVVSSAQRGTLSGVVVRSAFGAQSSTSATGAFTLPLPAGDHVLQAIELPVGCGADPVAVTVPSGGSATADIAVTCTVIEDVAVGTTHVCAGATPPRVQCWGDNTSGALGVAGAPVLARTPVAHPGPIQLTDLTSGYSHTCGLASGTAFCWGLNAFGALGLGTLGGVVTTPAAVQTGGVTFVQVVAGGYHTCGLTPAGEAWCWGWNTEGQTGIGSAGSPVILPQRVQDGGTRFSSLAAGESHTCGITAAGAAYCWGGNARGELGDPAGPSYSAVPSPVPGGLTFTQLDGGLVHTCGLVAGGQAYCWGDRTWGQVGDGGTDSVIVGPTAVAGGRTYTNIAAGGETTCAVEAGTQAIWCWGRGDQGSLGNGTTTPRQSTPTATVAMPSGGAALTSARVDVGPASGPQGSPVCATRQTGDVYCWGPGGSGQLGNGATPVVQSMPAQVRLLPP